MKLSNETKLKIRTIYGIFNAVALIALGALFIKNCYDIYTSGPNPFTRESVGAVLLSMLIPIIITLALTLGGFILSLVFGVERDSARALVTDEVLERRLLAQRELTADATIYGKVEGERRLRSLFKMINVALFIIGMVLVAFYVINPTNYTDDLNASVINLTGALIIPLTPSLVIAVARLILEPLSYKREIEALRTLPRADGSEPVSNNPTVFDKIGAFFKKNERQITLGVRIALILAGAVYLVLGIFGGGMADVFEKAIKICTECIGLG